MLNQAFKVFDFLKIKYPDNAQYNAILIAPLSLAIIFSLIATWAAINLKNGNYFLSDRFGDLFTLLAILPGFYIASLSAIAAINKPAIDRFINEKNAPYIEKIEPDRAESFKQKLTRRVFLTMLFAYLSSISLLLALGLALLKFLFTLNKDSGLIIFLSSSPLGVSIYFLASLITLFFIFQLLILTLIGVNYLGYKGLVDN
ncbi:hypothetical protein [Acinetobacter junii]|uniref:hypothetical protein n=1 Tax=Acinetobacter junii TaxID=40215 RepID=UPI00124E4CD2|nr:hypothetical protein [Acinetobacter junii]MDH1690845.1 hypothetical protein [Acinetobacter junii]VTX54168.1 Uncharacterised protein [Acinetobacter junii]